jgi:hypothetical protein
LHCGRKPGDESLEASLVVLIERIELPGIYVENSDQITLRPANRYHDLGTGLSVTRDVTRKFADIRHNHRLHLRSSSTAYSAAKGDLETSK